MTTINEPLTIKELYTKAVQLLKDGNVADFDIDARYLLEYVTGISSSRFLLEMNTLVEEEKCNEYLSIIKKRASRIPLQHITGEQEFMGLSFKVNENVLIPRQDTEILVEEALKYTNGSSVLDMCTGSGCIAISIAKLGKPLSVVGVDLSPKALEVARENAVCNEVDNLIEFRMSDLFDEVEDLKHGLDVIVSNPPYIPGEVIKTLMPEVKDHEPDMALRADNDGLEFYEKITKKAVEYLKNGGVLLYEIGCEQGQAVKEILENNSFTEVKIIKDYASLDRVVCGVWNE